MAESLTEPQRHPCTADWAKEGVADSCPGRPWAPGPQFSASGGTCTLGCSKHLPRTCLSLCLQSSNESCVSVSQPVLQSRTWQATRKRGRHCYLPLCILRTVRSRLQGSQTTPVGSHGAWTVAGKGHSRQNLHQLRALHASQLPIWAPTPDTTPTASREKSLSPASESSVISRYNQGRKSQPPCLAPPGAGA